MADWRAAVITALGGQPNAGGLQLLGAWQPWEGGHTNNTATYNWLNTTRGSQFPSINSVGVRAFPDFQTGVQYTSDTLRNYPALTKALVTGKVNFSDPKLQGDFNMWLTGKHKEAMSPYVAKIAKSFGQNVPYTPPAAPQGMAAVYDQQQQAPGVPPTQPLPTEQPKQQWQPDMTGTRLVQALSLPPEQRIWAMLDAVQQQPQPQAPPPQQQVPEAMPQAPAPPMQTPQAPAQGPGSGGAGIRELFYDPRGAYDEGNWINPIGGHSNHVHVSFGNPQAAMWAIEQAKRMGLRASENPYAEGSPAEKGVHTGTSYHYRNFPGTYEGGLSPTLGRGLDVSGNAKKMAAYYDMIVNRYGLR